MYLVESNGKKVEIDDKAEAIIFESFLYSLVDNSLKSKFEGQPQKEYEDVKEIVVNRLLDKIDVTGAVNELQAEGRLKIPA